MQRQVLTVAIELTKIPFIGANSRNYTAGRSGKKIEYIVIHYTAGTNDTARANAKYFQSFREASAHYFVDSKEIIQTVKDENAAWHCGTQWGYKHPKCRNVNSVGIEICTLKDGKGNYSFAPAAVRRAAELTAALMKKYGIPIGNVIRHYDVTGKVCPAPMVNDKNQWKAFLKLCEDFSEMSTEDYIGIVQRRVARPFEKQTIEYLNKYKYSSELWKRLAEME